MHSVQQTLYIECTLGLNAELSEPPVLAMNINGSPGASCSLLFFGQ